MAKNRDLADLLDQTLPCRQKDPELWFADDGPQQAVAKKDCQLCRVRIPCLKEGLQPHNIEFGIWGGTTPEERAALLEPTTEEQEAS